MLILVGVALLLAGVLTLRPFADAGYIWGGSFVVGALIIIIGLGRMVVGSGLDDPHPDLPMHIDPEQLEERDKR